MSLALASLAELLRTVLAPVDYSLHFCEMKTCAKRTKRTMVRQTSSNVINEG